MIQNKTQVKLTHLRSLLFLDVTQCTLVVTNALGQPVGSVFIGPAA